MQLKPGDVFHSKYLIERQLGRGGAGIVFQARHKRLAKSVAIKVLSSEGAADEQSRARFEREAMATSGLQSRHIVRIYDVDVTTDGLPFIVMELLEGRDLGSILRQEEISVTRAVDIMIQVCSALADAHAAGIIHRDIKPSNIFLSEPGQVVKVVDFGVSKVLSAEELTTHHLSFIGTPRYMPPEQLKGVSVDARADIWASGVMLYRLLTKHFPIEVDDQAESIVKALATLSTDPTHIAKHRPDLPGGLQDTIMWALRKELDERCPSAQAFAEALSPYGSGMVSLELPGSFDTTTLGATQRTITDILHSELPHPSMSGTSKVPFGAFHGDGGTKKLVIVSLSLLGAVGISIAVFRGFNRPSPGELPQNKEGTSSTILGNSVTEIPKPDVPSLPSVDEGSAPSGAPSNSSMVNMLSRTPVFQTGGTGAGSAPPPPSPSLNQGATTNRKQVPGSPYRDVSKDSLGVTKNL